MIRRFVVVGCSGVVGAVERLVRSCGSQSVGEVHCVNLSSSLVDPFLADLIAAQQTYEEVARVLNGLPVGELRDTAVLIGMPLLTPVMVRCLKGDRRREYRSGTWDCLKRYGIGRATRFGLSVETVAAWWILSYPEVRWLWWFPGKLAEGDRRSPGGPGCSSFLNWHGLEVGTLDPRMGSRFSRGSRESNGIIRFFPALFDPSGLRASIRSAVGRSLWSREGGYQLCRETVVLAVDEEREYAQLAGYAGYRAGHRVWAASSWTSFQYIWDWQGAEVPDVRASLEDLYLSFPDQENSLPRKRGLPEESHRLSCLRYRDTPVNGSWTSLMAASPLRVLMTVGHKRGSDGRRIWRENLRYLRRKPGSWSLLRKPVGSVYRLARQVVSHKARMKWTDCVRAVQRMDTSRHSAPGRLLAIAEVLLDRGTTVLSEARNPVDALHAAVLALEAKELLSGLTPTTTLEAIALQHEAEVTAESLFLGVQHNIDLDERFKDVAEEVNAVAYWFGRRHWVRSALNARLTIIERIAQRLRNLNQIEEELACLAEARELRFEFWVREKPWRWALWPFLAYIAFSLRSLPRFIVAVLGVCLFFGLSYFAFGALAGRADLSLWDAVTSGSKGFVTIETAPAWQSLTGRQGAEGWERFWNLWLSFQGAVSLTNFGLLISHLYMIVSRR